MPRDLHGKNKTCHQRPVHAHTPYHTKNSNMKKTTITLAALAASSLTLISAPVTYFGEDLSSFSGPSCEGRKRTLQEIPNSVIAANRFLSRLMGAATENFEAFSPGQSVTTLAFGPDTATISGTYLLRSPAEGHYCGEFATSGTNYIDVEGDYAIDFSHPQAAFGFYVTDIEVSRLILTFVSTNGTRNVVPVPSTLPQPSSGAAFFGVIDIESPFVRVEFSGAGAQDGYGFDDLTIGRVEQVHPEPASIDIALYAGLTITGTTGATYRIEFAPSLPSTNWTTLTNLLLPSSPYLYFDVQSVTNYARRFYRAVTVE